MGKVIIAALAFGAGLLLTGCHKAADSKQKSAAAAPPTSADNNGIIGVKIITPKLTERDLGAVTLTNHHETCLHISSNRDCLVTPLLIDSKTVQLTLALESKKPNGKIQDLSITQVTAKPGTPFEVVVGDHSFSLTPNIVSE